MRTVLGHVLLLGGALVLLLGYLVGVALSLFLARFCLRLFLLGPRLILSQLVLGLALALLIAALLLNGVRASEIARSLLRPAGDLVGDAHAASLLALLPEPLGEHRLRSTGSLFVVRLHAFEERGQLVVVLAPRVVDVGRERPRVLERLLEHRHEVVVLVVGLAALSCHLGSPGVR